MLSYKFNPFTSNFDTVSLVTLAAVGGTPSANGATINPVSQILTLQPADATHPGVVTTLPQTFAGSKTFTSSISTTSIDVSGSGTFGQPIAASGIDVLGTGGTDTLSIGTTNADIINIGRSGITINIQGTTLYENVSQLQVTDPLITINKGGGVGSGANSGIEIEENSIITAYAETSADRNSWILKAPNTAGIATITPGSGGITLDQSSHNPVTLDAFGSSPNANAASLSTQVLTLQPASATFPGGVSTTTQSFAGDKTFTGSVSVQGTLSLTTPLTVPNGGTGASSLTANNVILGNGTSAVQFVAPGTSGNVLTSNGTTWSSSAPTAPNLSVTSQSTTFTITTQDVVLGSASGAAFTITLPSVTTTGRVVRIDKTDSSFNAITISRAGSALINGATSTTLNTQYESVTLVADGTNWYILSRTYPQSWVTYTPTGTWNTNTTYSGMWRRVGDQVEISVYIILSGAPNTATLKVSIPSGLTIDTNKVSNPANLVPNANPFISAGSGEDAGIAGYTGFVANYFTTTTALIRYIAGTGNGLDVSETVPFTWGSGDFLSVRFQVPVSGWN